MSVNNGYELYKKAHQLGLKRDWEEDDEIRTTVLSLMALPLLPRERIRIALNHIRINVNTENEGVNNFIDYVSTTWLQGVQPHRLSVNRQFRRIINVFQPYRNCIASRIGSFVEIWSFTRK
ncbi:uncharacterized protein LOC122504776 isoform X2 [Leptopilina heterotoma]|uniref:uncharacterized protein LOC122504776 isoform X2 n=1 Tax=Leptopilina heterotoma TaxID=63436 RepID=UPI001CA96DC0|nr:uncharacterized protein LOC122504776 isoform X2 [Leptopilina heterotoma]